MLSNRKIQELFDAIYQLYSKITLKILHHRIQKHHERKYTDSSHDITKHLTKHVHHLVKKHREATSKVTWKKSTFIIKNTPHVTTLDDYKNTNSPNIINPFSDYLKNKRFRASRWFLMIIDQHACRKQRFYKLYIVSRYHVSINVKP